MIRRIFLILLMLGFFLQIHPNSKLSPWVRMIMLEKATSVGHKKSVKMMGRHDMRTTVFIRINNITETDAAFAANDCIVYDRQGDICIVSVPVGNIEKLASLSSITRIEANKSCNITMDTTAIVVKASSVYNGESLPQAYTGKDVVLGIMDVGFDLTHPNFYNSAATTYRIGAFWDQLDKDTIGSGYPVGRDYAGYEAVLAKKHSADGLMQTHGTHTLGIAAGSGYNSSYRGMAFESDICAVSNAISSNVSLIDSADIYKYTTAVDALGFKYMFDYAERLGKPCVASFSEGYTVGMDSEDSLFAAYLNQITGPGKIIIASAGNESQKYAYLPKPFGKSSAGSFIFSGRNDAYLIVQAQGRFQLRLQPYAEGRHSLDINSDDNTLDSLAVYDTPELLTAMAFRYPSSFNAGDTMYYIKISSPQPITGAVPIAVIVSGEDAQVAVRTFSSTIFVNGQGDSRWSDAEISHNVHAPACFEGVIAVGSTIHRTGFTNYQGTYRDYTQAGRNDGVWSVYSSVGPTLDGRIKPDVVAPGNNIISSYSSYYIEANPNASDVNSDVEHFDYNGRTYAWNANTGTSMATPVVAGAVALWLQANPKLTPDDVIKIISKTSRLPESGMDYPNNKYGHGEIDVYKGLLEVLNLSDIKEISKNEASNVRACFADDGNLCLSFNKAPNKTFSVTLYSISGRLLYKTAINANNSAMEYRVSVPKLIDGVYLVQFSGASFAPSSMLVRK